MWRSMQSEPAGDSSLRGFDGHVSDTFGTVSWTCLKLPRCTSHQSNNWLQRCPIDGAFEQHDKTVSLFSQGGHHSSRSSSCTSHSHFSVNWLKRASLPFLFGNIFLHSWALFEKEKSTRVVTFIHSIVIYTVYGTLQKLVLMYFNVAGKMRRCSLCQTELEGQWHLIHCI